MRERLKKSTRTAHSLAKSAETLERDSISSAHKTELIMRIGLVFEKGQLIGHLDEFSAEDPWEEQRSQFEKMTDLWADTRSDAAIRPCVGGRADGGHGVANISGA
jgi:hypothetical protein